MEKFTFFWRSHSIFSQWFIVSFVVDAIVFNCAEQYMMYKKAELFEDKEAMHAILAEKSPKKQKDLGRKVRNFKKDVWDNQCEAIVFKGNYSKFSQNPKLLEALLATSGTTLVEASPVDKIWGIGLAEDDPRALNRDAWLGKNLLGKVLTEIREKINKLG